MSVTSAFGDEDVAGASRSVVVSGCAIGRAEYMPDSHALGWTAAQSTTERIATARCIAVSVAHAVGENTGDRESRAGGPARLPAIGGASLWNIREIPAVGHLRQHDLVERRAADADTYELDVARNTVRHVLGLDALVRDTPISRDPLPDRVGLLTTRGHQPEKCHRVAPLDAGQVSPPDLVWRGSASKALCRQDRGDRDDHHHRPQKHSTYDGGSSHGRGVRGGRSCSICSSVRSTTQRSASLDRSMRVKNSPLPGPPCG